MLIAASLSATGCRSAQDRTLRLAALVSLGNDEIVHVNRKEDTRVPAWRRIWDRPDPPSERTSLLLRHYNLEKFYETRPDDVIHWLHELVQIQPLMEEVHALAELAEKQASWSRRQGDQKRATRLYATAIIHAYHFLFDEDLNLARNAYDPQFRSICDVYNSSLEGLLREICVKDGFAEGFHTIIGEDDRGIELEVKLEGRWQSQEFEKFELVNDFSTDGFDNQHHTYGLGVPLIAVRKQQPVHLPSEKYYPPDLTLPMTAFMHLDPEEKVANANGKLVAKPRKAVLSLYDPLEQTLVKTKNKVVPLESDITTPLAYSLRDPILNKGVLATASLLGIDAAEPAFGMYMLEPYDPNKIPVVMVHGIWSSPPTWAHMFNDLRASQDIHQNYQFWFYSYPTAQPFWISAKQLRADLVSIRSELDPNGSSKPLDQMIFVGHSMGGLVASMQTMESGDHFWNIVSDQPIDEFEGDPETIQEIRDTFFFQPNPSIDRVISIATPFQGSNFVNSTTRWIGQKLITLPSLVTSDFQKVAQRNENLVDDPSFLTTTNSVDSLSPTNPVFEALAKAERNSELVIHNIVGREEKRSFFSSTEQVSDSDGVVAVESAQLSNARSQVFVPEEHQKVHQHPGCILEVRRILLENLAERDRVRARPLPEFYQADKSAIDSDVERR